MEIIGDKWVSAGGIVFNETFDSVYVFKPLNGYGNVMWTFPKGRVDEGESLTEAALREVLEESGVRGELLSQEPLVIGEGACSVTHYFPMRAVSVGEWTGDETVEVRLVKIEILKHYLNQYRDLDVVLPKIQEYVMSRL